MIIKSRSVESDNVVELSRALAREALVELGRPVELRHRCPECGGMGHGHPLAYLANVSLARNQNIVAAVATLGSPVGVAVSDFGKRNGAQKESEFLALARLATWKAWGKNPRIPVTEIEIFGDLAKWKDLSCFLISQDLQNYQVVVAQQLPKAQMIQIAPVLRVKDLTP